MGSFRRVAAVALLTIGISTFLAAPAHAAGSLTVVVMDVDTWQRFAERHGAVLGLGVYPDSRDPLRFVEEIGTGAPTARPGARSVVRGVPGSLGAALSRAGVGVERQAFDDRTASALARAFAGAPRASRGPDTGFPRVDNPTIVLGIGPKTPVWVAICREAGCTGTAELAVGGIARRPAIITPYDLAATILDLFDIEQPETFIGNPLRREEDGQALDEIRRLTTHLERGAGLGATMGATSTVTAIVMIGLGLLFAKRGRRDLSARAGQAATFAAAGYMGAIFVPSGNGAVRALAIGAAIGLGGAIHARDPATIGRIAFAVAGLFALLVVVAPLRPGGLPGAAIWGNPLISWRFFGLQNYEVSFLASMVVVWGVLARLRPVPFALVTLAATVLIGAPRVGSNFVGVLTIAFGAALAVIALARRRVELWQAFVAAGIATTAFVLALIADAGSPVSHGGRAAQRISEGGFSTLVDFVEARLRLNLDLIRGFPLGLGFPFMTALLAIAAALIVWSVKPGRHQRARIAVWAGAAMAACSLILEDSGFYAGPIILVTAAAAWMVVTSSDVDDELSSSDLVSAGAG